MSRIISPPLEEINKLRAPLTEGELRVLNYFIDVLPASWEIYIQPHLNGLRPDFVLLHPKNGIAVYEVKDWHLSAMTYFVKTRQNRPPLLMGTKLGKTFSLEKQNPVTKIAAYKEEIYGLYCPSLPTGAGFGSIIAGVIFTNIETSEAKSLLRPLREHYGHEDYAKLYPVIGYDILQDHHEATVKRSVLPSLHMLDPRMNSGAAADLRHWLVEPEFSAEQRRPLQTEMTPRQREICINKGKVAFRRIRGPAGSGKSLVLAGRAAQLAMDGKRVLLVTFNITLINYLLDLAVRYAQSGKVRGQIEAMNYHEWCKRLALESGHIADYHELWANEDHDDVLGKQLPRAVCLWSDDLDELSRWDAILVDEAQDFQLAWWASLRLCLRRQETGEMMLCADGSQNVYGVTPWTETQMSGAGFRGRWLELNASYRLPPSLCMLAEQFIRDYLPGAEGPPPAAPQGRLDFKTRLVWRQVDSGSLAQHCAAELLELIRTSDPPLSFSDLVCLVDSSDVGLEVVGILRQHNISVLHTFGTGESEAEVNQDSRRKKIGFYKGDARVKVTTVHSFKGWESKAIVVQISKANTLDALALAYTGITRLKWDSLGCYLRVINSTKELEAFGRDWPVPA